MRGLNQRIFNKFFGKLVGQLFNNVPKFWRIIKMFFAKYAWYLKSTVCTIFESIWPTHPQAEMKSWRNWTIATSVSSSYLLNHFSRTSCKTNSISLKFYVFYENKYIDVFVRSNLHTQPVGVEHEVFVLLLLLLLTSRGRVWYTTTPFLENVRWLKCTSRFRLICAPFWTTTFWLKLWDLLLVKGVYFQYS
jgi:hypothetical protein